MGKIIVDPYRKKDKEKLEHIKKNYELFFYSNDRLRQQVFTLRGWCITLLIGYTSFVISRCDISPNLIYPVIAIPFFFYLLEGFMESNCNRTTKREKEINKIFENANELEFLNKVREFSFPLSDKWSNPKKTKSIKNYWVALCTQHILAWYFIIYFMLFVILTLLELIAWYYSLSIIIGIILFDIFLLFYLRPWLLAGE